MLMGVVTMVITYVKLLSNWVYFWCCFIWIILPDVLFIVFFQYFTEIN